MKAVGRSCSRVSIAPAIVETPGDTAAFDGYWETIAVQQTSVWDESSVVYSAYRCDIGDPFGESAQSKLYSWCAF